ENALVSMAQQFSGLPMSSLIGAPLNAAAKANSAMAVTQTKFILDTCFEHQSDPDNPDNQTDYNPIMINMTLTRPIIHPPEDAPTEDNPNPAPSGIDTATTTFNLPLLTVIPINSLGVDNATVTFEMEVKSSYSEQQTVKHEKEMKAKA